MFDLQHSLLAFAILFGAYLIRGVSGFGSALVSVPILAHFFPLSLVVPWLAALDLVGSIWLSHAGWRDRHIRWGEISSLLLPSLIGILAGVFLLQSLPDRWLLLALGSVVAVFGLRGALRAALGLSINRMVSRAWAVPAGLGGGLVDALFATGGPPFVIYLTHRLSDKSELRATLSALFLLEGATRMVIFIVAGLLWQPSMTPALLIGLPALALGLLVGNRIHLGISQRWMALAVGLLLIGSGAAILSRAI